MAYVQLRVHFYPGRPRLRFCVEQLPNRFGRVQRGRKQRRHPILLLLFRIELHGTQYLGRVQRHPFEHVRFIAVSLLFSNLIPKPRQIEKCLVELPSILQLEVWSRTCPTRPRGFHAQCGGRDGLRT
jgi:hypothetical protein